MSYFKTLPQNPNFYEMENQTLDWWRQHDIVKKYLNKNKDSDKQFSFIDGPITANGPMGVHHARGRTIKDVIQRYKNMQGYQQRFQNGFDCQGLWVEVEVEKENGFNSKKDILDFGLNKFTDSCVSRVKNFAKIQTDQSIRLGMFMDWENSYYTMSESNNLYIWHFLKTIHQKGWLYKKKSATTWCPRCETGLSQHEQADGYREITDESVYIKFKLKDSSNKYFLAWTTTPWTLSSNVLLAINTNFQYVEAQVGDETLYLAKESATRLGLDNTKDIDAKTLLNLEYESLYDIPAQKNIKHYIVEWEMVNPQEGTGIVHIAPGCGQEDFQLGTQLKSDIIAPLDETGHFMDGYGQLTGKYALKVNQEVIDYLKDNKALFKTEPITHRYPHCWRCKTKCLFRLEDNWFIDCQKIRQELITNSQKVNWMPKYVAKRMLNWLNNMEDWMISRKRFYGLALPFYECSCGHLTVVGSKEELKKLAVNPQKVDQLKSLHRPYIDEIEIKCPHCQKIVKRISDVGDCWLDAGVVPFSTLKYLEDKKYWQKWFPAELVCEMTEQVRLWYYSMLFFSVALENTTPYLNVLNYAEVRDEKGEKMSKTKKNGIPFEQAVENMTVDAMRWLYCLQKSHNTVNFGFNISDQVKRDFILILWNSYKFFVEHANLDNWKPSDKFDPQSASEIIDKWIISRLHSTISKSTKYLNKYNLSSATNNIQKFITDLSTWYIRRNRDRHDHYGLLYYCFENITRLIAPFVPFISESIYRNLSQEQSVHLQQWPDFQSKLIDHKLEKEMEEVREICRLTHAQRQKAGIKVRQPLSLATINSTTDFSPELINIIQEETNFKKVKINNQPGDLSVEIDTTLNEELIAEGEYRDFVRSIQILRKENHLDIQDNIKIYAPNWPKKFEKEILQKTLGVSLTKADNLKIEKVNV